MSNLNTPKALDSESFPDGVADPTQRRFRGSGKITDYEIMKEKLGEGTFGVVSKARSKRTGQMVALKKILMHNEKDGFPITALREVKLLKMLTHTNVLQLEEMAIERIQNDDKGKAGKKRATLYMVTPYMDHDLSGMLTNPDIRFSEAQIKCYMQQLLEGVRYLHDSHILHRDMKAANILISNKGILQIADFGLARHYEGATPQPGQGNGEAVRDYTSLVVTRWYRPPELLLTLKRYTPAIDMWGVGCVFGEMFETKPILEGHTDVNQCEKIFKLLGPPTEQSMPGWSDLPGCEGRKEWETTKPEIDKRFGRIGPQGLHLLKQMLCLDWRRRINAYDALRHEYFTTPPLPARAEDIPRYEDSHELDARRRGRQAKQERQLPPAPAGGTVGMGPDELAYGYGYDRPPRGYSRDRPPQGRGYDDRRGPPGDGGRQPAWRQDPERGTSSSRPIAPPPTGHQLPPRPDGLIPRADPLPTRGPPPPAASRSNVDTYIPAYQSGAADARGPPPPRDAFVRGGRRNSRENAYHDPDIPAPPRAAYRDGDRYNDSYRDRDRRDMDWERSGDYRHRDRDEMRGTRSRSPDRERRERLQDREREMYRR